MRASAPRSFGWVVWQPWFIFKVIDVVVFVRIGFILNVNVTERVVIEVVAKVGIPVFDGIGNVGGACDVFCVNSLVKWEHFRAETWVHGDIFNCNIDPCCIVGRGPVTPPWRGQSGVTVERRILKGGRVVTPTALAQWEAPVEGVTNFVMDRTI